MALRDISFVQYSDAIRVDKAYYYAITASNDETGEITQHIFRDGVNPFQEIADYNGTIVSYSLILEVSPTSKYISTLTYAERYSIPFVRYGDNRVLITVPSTYVNEATIGGENSELDVTSYYLTSSALTKNSALSMSFEVNKHTLGQATGALKLSQQVIKAILSRFRSNRFALGEGTGLLTSLGKNLNKQMLSEVITDALDATEHYILSNQNATNNLSVSPDELLSELLVSSISVTEDRAEATLIIVTEAGSAVTIPVLI